MERETNSSDRDVDIAFCMVKKHEPKGFEIDLPQGREDHALFLMFETPVTIDCNGESKDYEKNCCIVYEAKTRTAYSSKTTEMYNSFILFDHKNASFFEQYSFPLNTPFYLNSDAAEKLALMLDDMSFCFLFRPSSNNRIRELFFEIMQFLSDNCRSVPNRRKRNLRLIEQLESVRKSLYAHPVGTSVKDMAKQLYFDRCYFSTVYKRTFHTTPAEDITAAKLLYAKKLLLLPETSVEQVSDTLGFDNPGNFIRFFKKQTGITPHAYITQQLDSLKNN